jgi:ABC-type branched-subunit amino acid transport system substrate-binding protein
MKINVLFPALCWILLALFAIDCTARRTGAVDTRPPVKPGTKPNKYEPIDTVRWTDPANPKPPIKNGPGGNKPNGGMGNYSKETYRVALLLPFLSNQFQQGAVPEKSRLGLQFYTGVKIALEEHSKAGGPNIQLDVYDTQASDADFQAVLNDRNLGKAQVLIGPVRTSHVQLAAAWAKSNRKILISPESPNAGIAIQQPDFIQMNPSLRAHCEVIAQYINARLKNSTVTLVCKQKEADRLPYFQDYLQAINAAPYGEMVVPDETLNFDKTSFAPFFKPGKTAVFILPSWASQDFVMAFFRKLKAVKGNNSVAVFGMPQWKNFESIDPEYLLALNVHITAASYVHDDLPETQAFQQAFYDKTGAIPDDDGFNGYDLTRWLCTMLGNYGLSFPEHLQGNDLRELHGNFHIAPVFNNGVGGDAFKQYDYLENKFVHILQFKKYGFEPVE